MTANAVLIETKDRGWLNGFMTLWRKESHAWWGTTSWLVRILIWMAIIDGLLAVMAFAGPALEAGGPGSSVHPGEAPRVEEPIEQDALTTFFIIAGVVPAIGVIILGQEAIIDERKLGTAAWVLSKPVSRPAFLLSKLCAHALGILATMVLVQGAAAYFIYKAATGISLPVPGFLAAVGLVYLFQLFFLTLTLMLGVLFPARGPVLGIPLAVVSSSYLAVLVPFLGQIMPANLIMALGNQPCLAAALAQGQPLPTVTPILATVVWITVFILISFVRFGQEEF